MDETTSFVEIDRDRLDDEWVGQPKLFYKYARRLADARADLAEAKAELSVVEAEVDMDVRAKPDKYKLTIPLRETAIKLRVAMHVKVKDKTDAVRKLTHRVDVLEAAVKALEHRKSALERLVTLHGQSYFSTPKTPDPEFTKTVSKKVFGKKGGSS